MCDSKNGGTLRCGRETADRKRTDTNRTLPPRKRRRSFGIEACRSDWQGGRRKKREAPGESRKPNPLSNEPSSKTQAFGQGNCEAEPEPSGEGTAKAEPEPSGKGTATEPTEAARPRPEPAPRNDPCPGAVKEREQWGLVATPAPISVCARPDPQPFRFATRVPHLGLPVARSKRASRHQPSQPKPGSGAAHQSPHEHYDCGEVRRRRPVSRGQCRPSRSYRRSAWACACATAPSISAPLGARG